MFNRKEKKHFDESTNTNKNKITNAIPEKSFRYCSSFIKNNPPQGYKMK